MRRRNMPKTTVIAPGTRKICACGVSGDNVMKRRDLRVSKVR